MAKELNTVGKSVRDYTGLGKVTGTAKFCNDYRKFGMLEAKLLRSPHAHANILSIDTSEAEALPGVRLVMCYKNFPDVFFKSVHYVGMEVACVVADNKRIAKEATKLIKVEYEVLPFVIDPAKAAKSDSPQVLPDKPNYVPYDKYWYWYDRNEKGQFTKRKKGNFDGYGDIEQGYKDSEVVVEGKGYVFPRQQAPLMSTTSCIADFDNEDLTVYFNTQAPYLIRAGMSRQLKLPLNRIHIQSKINASCFGSRIPSGVEAGISGPSCTIVASAASMALEKPVLLEYDRDEEALFYWGRGSYDSKMNIGFKEDGTMVMMDGEIWRNASTGGVNGFMTLGFDATPTGTMLYSHNCQHSSFKKNSIFTNGPGWTGWQGYGNPEAFFLVESTMDEAAEKLGIDPVDLRRKNVMQEGDNFLSLHYRFDGPSYLSRSGLNRCIDVGVEKTDWYNRRKPASEKTGKVRHGMGMAMSIQQTGGQGLFSQAIVTLQGDGTASLISNYQELGQGGHGAQVQIVAETLGIPYKNVTIKAGDTDTPYTHWEACSSGTVVQGYATYRAAMDAKTKLLDRAAKLLQVPAEALDTKDAKVFVKASPDKAIPWTLVFMQTLNPAEDLGNAGMRFPEDIIGYGENRLAPGATSSEQGVTFADLDVDTETGKLSNIKITYVQDCGKALNPKVVEANWLSIHHGVEAMIGAVQILDEKTGKLLNDNWIDYPVATILDCSVEPNIVEVFDPTHPYGAAGIAQANQNGISAAMSNAIYNAIGVRLKEVPFTPEKILKALGKI